MLKLALMDLLGPETYTARLNPNGGVKIERLENPMRRLEGRDWPANGVTMVGRARLDNLQACIEAVLADAVPGDLIETGAWRGGASIFARAVMRAHDSDRRIWVADSFKGLPPPEHPEDSNIRLHMADYLAVPLEEVKRNFERYDLLDDQVRFVEGYFSDTLPGLRNEWAVVRLDGDMYDSTMVALESLYPSLSPGGFLIIDDYQAFEPCRKAVADYRDKHGIGEPIEQIDWTGVFWRKSGSPR